MSLVFSLLQKDYILLAADSRHTRGDPHGGTYKNDRGVKTVEALHGNAILAFAGHDFGERLVSEAKRSGLLDKDGSLQQVAEKLSQFARDKYEEQYGLLNDSSQSRPLVELMLAGWSQSLSGDKVATVYTHRLPGELSYFESTYPLRWFDIIGKSCHGALYGLHRFCNQELTIDIALRVSAFVMREVCEQDISTGGGLQVYVLAAGAKAIKKTPEEIDELTRIAKAAGAELEDYLLLRRN